MATVVMMKYAILPALLLTLVLPPTVQANDVDCSFTLSRLVAESDQLADCFLQGGQVCFVSNALQVCEPYCLDFYEALGPIKYSIPKIDEHTGDVTWKFVGPGILPSETGPKAILFGIYDLAIGLTASQKC